MTRARSRRRRGFTIVEVMIAIGVMTVGSMAIIGMQVQTTRQNQLAREYLLATQFAQTWSERLKIDALSWTTVPTVDGNPTVALALQNTRYLLNLLGPGTGTQFAQITPSALSFHKQGATFNGYDIPGNTGLSYTDPIDPTGEPRKQSFCADARLAWVYFGRALRADVRVYWPKPGNVFANDTCTDSGDRLRPGTGPDVDKFHVVYLPNVLRVTELR